MSRVLYEFTQADAEKIAGRRLWPGELGSIESALQHSTLREVIEDVVFAVVGSVDDPDEE